MGMMKATKVTKQYSLLVFIKNKYKYSDQESKLQILADKLGGRNIGGGTNLSTGKRDQQFVFNNKKDAKAFLSYSTVKESILKDYDLTEFAD
jgi:hypothetical protein